MTVLFCSRSLFDFISTSLHFAFHLVFVVDSSVSYIFYCSQQFDRDRLL